MACRSNCPASIGFFQKLNAREKYRRPSLASVVGHKRQMGIAGGDGVQFFVIKVLWRETSTSIRSKPNFHY